MYRAVIFDLGGVVFPSPFEAFDAYDVDTGLAPGSVRGLIKTSSETGAWAQLERYLGVAGLGFDSEVASYANKHAMFLRGSAVYLYSIFRVLPLFTPRTVSINGHTESIMFAAVGNSRQYGGGIRIVPEALIDDGHLNLCVVHRTSRMQLLKTLPKAYTGAHVKSPFVETGRGTSFTFASERPMDVYADGERITVTPVEFSLASERLRIVAP